MCQCHCHSTVCAKAAIEWMMSPVNIWSIWAIATYYRSPDKMSVLALGFCEKIWQEVFLLYVDFLTDATDANNGDGEKSNLSDLLCLLFLTAWRMCGAAEETGTSLVATATWLPPTLKGFAGCWLDDMTTSSSSTRDTPIWLTLPEQEGESKVEWWGDALAPNCVQWHSNLEVQLVPNYLILWKKLKFRNRKDPDCPLPKLWNCDFQKLQFCFSA